MNGLFPAMKKRKRIRSMKYHIGDKGSFSKTVTESDICAFAGISGDFNPVHVNKINAEKSIFGRQIAHGFLSASFISTAIGMYMPGPGTIYLKQELEFISPVCIGDTVTASVEITEIEGKKAVLNTVVMNQQDTLVIKGTATVRLPETS